MQEQGTEHWAEPGCHCRTCNPYSTPQDSMKATKPRPVCSCTPNARHHHHSRHLPSDVTLDSPLRKFVLPHISSTPAAPASLSFATPYATCPLCSGEHHHQVHQQHRQHLVTSALGPCVLCTAIQAHPFANCLYWDSHPSVRSVPFAHHEALCTCPGGVTHAAVPAFSGHGNVAGGQREDHGHCTCDVQVKKVDNSTGSICDELQQQQCRRRLWQKDEDDECDKSASSLHFLDGTTSGAISSAYCGDGNTGSFSSSYKWPLPAGQQIRAQNASPNVQDWQRRHLEHLAAQKREILGPILEAESPPDRTDVDDRLRNLPEEYLCTNINLDVDEELDQMQGSFVDDNKFDDSIGTNVESLMEEVEKLRAELGTERAKVQFYQVMLKRSQEEVDSLRSRFVEKTEMSGGASFLDDTGCDVASPSHCSSETIFNDSASSSSLRDAPVDRVNRRNLVKFFIASHQAPSETADRSCVSVTGASDCDEGVGSEGQSADPVLVSTHRQLSGQKFWLQHVAAVDHRVLQTFLAVADELMKKSKHVTVLRQTLKELSSQHHSLLERSFAMEDEVKRLKQQLQHSSGRRSAANCDAEMLCEVRQCVRMLQSVIALCSASLNGTDPPPTDDVASHLPDDTLGVRVTLSEQQQQPVTVRDVKLLRRQTQDLHRDAVNKLLVARYVH